MSSFAEGFSSTFGPIFQAIQSGKKFELQDEELKYLKLQVADYQGSQAYRDHQRNLELAMNEAQVATERKRGELTELQRAAAELELSQAKVNAPVETATAKERLGGARATRKATEQSTKFAAENQDYARKLQGQTLAQGEQALKIGESNLATAQIGQTNAQVQLAKALGDSFEPGAADLMNVVESLGIKGGDASKATIFQVLSGQQEAKRREITQLQQFMSQKNEEANLDKASRQAEIVRNIASQGSAYVEAIGTVMGKDNPIYKAAAETVARGGLPTDRSNVDPLALEEGKSLIKQIGDLDTEIRLKKQDLKNKQDDTYIFSSRKKAEGKPTAELADLEAQKAELEARRDQLSGGGSRPKSSKSTTVDLESIESALRKATGGSTIAGANTDEQLKKIAERFGLKFEDLVALRNAKRSK